ncbi:MAG: hypothetical protein H0T93_13650 [Chloroflexia bacterium]|nr:hypothetical protein [Chloroflexia bacterium]
MNAIKNKGVLAGIAALLIFILIGVGLYLLGGDDQSALERLRDIAIIFVVLTSALSVVFLAGITVALIVLFMQLKDKAMPILDETTGTINRIRGTTNFITEEAVKPLVTVASKYSRFRTMSRVVTGKQTKPLKIQKIEKKQ